MIIKVNFKFILPEQTGSQYSHQYNIIIYYIRVPKGFGAAEAPDSKQRGSRAPDQNKQGSRGPEKLIKGSCYLLIIMDAFNISCKCLWFSEALIPFYFTDSGIENVSVLSQGILEYGIAYVVKKGPQ